MIRLGKCRSVYFRTDKLPLKPFRNGKLRSKILPAVRSLLLLGQAFALLAAGKSPGLAGGISLPEAPVLQNAASGPWNFSVAKGPKGETNAAIMHTADFDHSDPLLAGLMLRCAAEGLDVIVISLLPFPPKTHPQVVLQNRMQTFTLEGSVIPTGAGVLVPIAGEELTHGVWQESPEMTVKIVDGNTAIQGVVELAGLPEAANRLESQCSKK